MTVLGSLGSGRGGDWNPPPHARSKVHGWRSLVAEIGAFDSLVDCVDVELVAVTVQELPVAIVLGLVVTCGVAAVG